MSANSGRPVRSSQRAKAGGVVQPVAMLESENEGLRGIVLTEERARLGEIMRLHVAGAANRFASRIDVERRAAT